MNLFRNNYTILHDLISKNYDKIINPIPINDDDDSTIIEDNNNDEI